MSEISKKAEEEARKNKLIYGSAGDSGEAIKIKGNDLYEIIENLADEFPHEDLIFVESPERQKAYKVFREMIDILESMAADGARFKKKGLRKYNKIAWNFYQMKRS